MAEFAIACPQCGKYAVGKKGFFSTRKINCACGYTIRVKTDKLMARTCVHCGNQVVFDQTEGDKAACPVCGEPINTVFEQQKSVEISCARCGVRLTAGRENERCVCPVCDYENDVQERQKQEQIRLEGLASVIKYEGDNETFVWKHPVEDFNLGSQLIVHESQEAVFFRDGQALDLFGPGRFTLETQQLPMLEKLYKLPTDTERTFHSEVYFINMATQMGIKWGTDSKVRLFDPQSGLHVEIGASGEFNIRVVNSRKLLLKVVGTAEHFSQEQLLGIGDGKGYFRSMVMTQVKSFLAQTIKENGISILEIDAELMRLSEALRDKINEGLNAYGLTMPEFFVGRIVTPDDDPNFARMKEQYAQQYLRVKEEEIRKQEAQAAAGRKAVEAETEARMKIIGAQGEAEALKIQKAAQAEAFKMQAEAEAAGMRMKGYNYQQETSRMVGMEAMQNGLGGSEGDGASALGSLAGLGIGLGAMGGVMNMTREAVNPVINASNQLGQNFSGVLSGTWDCACGQKANTGNFCSNCGAKKPEPPVPGAPETDGWSCSCGQSGNTGNFCSNCGKKRGE